jgi:hypothetical protein
MPMRLLGECVSMLRTMHAGSTRIVGRENAREPAFGVVTKFPTGSRCGEGEARASGTSSLVNRRSDWRGPQRGRRPPREAPTRSNAARAAHARHQHRSRFASNSLTLGQRSCASGPHKPLIRFRTIPGERHAERNGGANPGATPEAQHLHRNSVTLEGRCFKLKTSRQPLL